MASRRPLTTGQVADLFGVTASAVHDWVARGSLTGFRTPGGHLRFPPEEVERLYGGPLPEPEPGPPPASDTEGAA